MTIAQDLDGHIIIDKNSNIILVGGAAATMFGYVNSELIGRSITKLMPNASVQQHENSLQDYCTTGVRHFDWNNHHVMAIHKNGTEILVKLQITEIRISNERIFYAIITHSKTSP